MENQHRKIRGYRELSQVEIDLMNKVKEQGRVLNALVEEVRRHVAGQRDACRMLDTPEKIEEAARMCECEPERWASMGRTHFQEGLMALTRAVAQPEFF
jgi:hypothetical protein